MGALRAGLAVLVADLAALVAGPAVLVGGLAVVLLAAALGCSAETGGEAPRPSFLLVTLDTTRADRLGAYGYEAAHTPTLDRLAREGLLFENALSTAPTTLPSHASILTGVTPSEHGVRDNSVFALQPEAELVSEVLRAHGWRTAAFVGAFVLDPRFGLDQGFDHYGTSEEMRIPGVMPERRAGRVVKEALDWVEGLEPGEPFLLWVHFFDPHYPFAPPPRWRDRLEDPYDGEIAYCDEQIGRLLDGLASRGRSRGLVTLVTSDHGEGLGDHGESSHGLFVYQSTLRVPLILHGEAVRAAAGTRVGRFVSLTDIPATLLALAGLPASALPRASRFPLVDARGRPADAPADRAFYLEALTPFYSYGWRASQGIVSGGYKLIAPGELYALHDDPGETRDVASAEPARAAALRARLDQRARRESLGWGRRRGVDSDEAARLEALGYVVGTGSGDPFDDGLPTASQRRRDILAYARLESQMRAARALLDRHSIGASPANADVARGLERMRAATDGWAALHEADPGNPYVALRLGLGESMLGNHEAALAPLEQARAHDEADARLLYHLALAYRAAGRHREAQSAMEKAVAVEPENDFYAKRLDAFRVGPRARAAAPARSRDGP